MNEEFADDLGIYFNDEEDIYFEEVLKNTRGNDDEFGELKCTFSNLREPESAEEDSVESYHFKPVASNSNSENNGLKGNFSDSFYYTGQEADGFFLPSGNYYYYPTNFPVREYQKTIIETALFNNTLVVLPTGLGKTFIAAVVMYNFYRWYPRGLVIFMAPTRPLVTQQINACTNIMGIPPSDITEITGKSVKTNRIDSWKQKRIFFVTPQVMANDVLKNVCDPNRVRCVIFDEAHKARGNYSYCQVIRQMSDFLLKFRILALSATPGNNLEAYQEIIHNLNIAKVQVRAEDSPDVVKYIHGRKLSHIVLKLDNLWKQFQGKLLELYEDYSRPLKDHNVVRGNISTLSAYQVMTLMETFKRKKDIDQNVKNRCNMSLLVCQTLAHAHNLLYTYGFKALYSHFYGESDSCAMPILLKNEKLKSLLRAIDDYFKDKAHEETYVPSHPKFAKLREVIAAHFKTMEQNVELRNSKVIIYCQYRVGVTEAQTALKELEPLVRPVMFIGQSSGKKKSTGLGQKAQLEILNNFKSGTFNTLIATSIGEEGLDIGEVDLIICLDAQQSITRHIQRIGRTGRKRAGACIFLVTEGKEELKFLKCLNASSNFSKMIDPKLLNTSVTAANPRMVPKHIKPKLHFVHIQPDKGGKNEGNFAAEADEESGEGPSSSKDALKRKKNNSKNQGKKEKQSKEAKVERSSNKTTLFSYFIKKNDSKNFDSFCENDAEAKDIFFIVKDKAPKSESKSCELDTIPKDDCINIEENHVDAGSFNSLKVEGFTDLRHSDLSGPDEASAISLSKIQSDSSTQNETKPMISLFQSWVRNYAENRRVLFDENWFDLIHHFMKESSKFPPYSCNTVNTPKDFTLVDYDITFNSSSDESESPVIMSRKPLASSPVILESEPNFLGSNSPILSGNSFKTILSPVNCKVKTHSDLQAGSTSTPKLPSKFKASSSVVSHRMDSNSSLQISIPLKVSVSNQVVNNDLRNSNRATFDEENMLKMFGLSSDPSSFSPEPLTFKISSLVGCETSNGLFPNENNVVTTFKKEKEQDITDLKEIFFGSPKYIIRDMCISEKNTKTYEHRSLAEHNICKKTSTSSPEILTSKVSKSVNLAMSKQLCADGNGVASSVGEGTKQADCIENVKQILSDSFDMFLGNLEDDFLPSVQPPESFSQDQVLTQKENNAPNFTSNIKPNESLKPTNSKSTSGIDTAMAQVESEFGFLLRKNLTFSSLSTKSSILSKESLSSCIYSPQLNRRLRDECKSKDTESSVLIQSMHKTKDFRPGNENSDLPQGKYSNEDGVPFMEEEMTNKSIVVRKFYEGGMQNPKLEKDSSKENNSKENFNLLSLWNPKNSLKFCEGPKLPQQVFPKRLSSINTETGPSKICSSNPHKSSPWQNVESESRGISFANKHNNSFMNPSVSKDAMFSKRGGEMLKPEFQAIQVKNQNSPDSKFHDLTVADHAQCKNERSRKNKHKLLKKELELKNANKDGLYSGCDFDDIFFELQPSDKPRNHDEPPKVSNNIQSFPSLKKAKKKKNCFIEWEAEVSGSDVSEDENEDEDKDQGKPDSFIHDDHASVSNHEHTITAQYLESIKSLPTGPGKFKIPVLSDKIDKNVYSQAFNNDTDYQNDSFCVDEEVWEEYDCSEDEKTFEETVKKTTCKSGKRKRIIDSNSSSEDVIEMHSSFNEESINAEITLLPDYDDNLYTTRKPTRRKICHSEKFSELKKIIEAKKSKNKPGAGTLSEELVGNSVSFVLQKSPAVQKINDVSDSDADSDDFFLKPSGRGINIRPKPSSNSNTNAIGKQTKKKTKMNLFSSDED
ncbi:unnamed protein product [Bemisia tabaci]|uniref:Fanconi anemia group M protein n=1 Tax=Bemisia tabaci TaxID=7038 RepID=A0A9P0CAP6_BEMTA|nr:unnamed protein product [Bemisia tabaci]